MFRGKMASYFCAALALAALVVAAPAVAVTTSGSVAATDERAPEPVSNVTAFAGAGGVELAWELSPSDFVRQSPTGTDFTSGGTFANVNDVAGYEVRRSENGDATELVAELDAGATEYVDETAVSGSSFIYTIVSVDAGGNRSGADSPPISLGTPPVATVDVPAEIDLGVVDPDETTFEEYGISNDAEEEDAVLSVTITVEGDGFRTILALEEEEMNAITLDPGEFGTFQVAFNASDVLNMNGDYEGVLTIRSNDPDNRLIVVELSASITEGVALPEISVSPASVGFGNRVVGTTASRVLTVANIGGLSLGGAVTIAGDAAFSIDGSSFSLGAEESAEFTVSFAVGAEQSYSATITVTTGDDDDEPVTEVAVTGTGVAEVTGPGVVATTVTKATMTFDDTLDTADDDAVATFKESFIAILADLLGISADRIVITSVTSGSVVVDFKITQTGGEEGEPTAVAALEALEVAVADAETNEFAALAPVESISDESEAVSLQPVDADGEPVLGWFTRAGSQVDFDDFGLFVDNFGLSEDDAGFDVGFDIAPSGKVDFDDFYKFVDNFGKTVANAAEIQAALE